MSEKEIVELQVKMEEMVKDHDAMTLTDDQQWEVISSLKSKVAVLESKMVIIYAILGAVGTALVGTIIGLIIK